MQQQNAVAVSLGDICGVGNRPEQFGDSKCSRCGCPLSRYNQYTLCSLCRHAVKKNELKKVGVLPRTKSGRIHWGKPLIDLKKRTPIKK